MNNGVEVNQTNLASTPVLTVDNSTSVPTSNFSVAENSSQPTLTVVQDTPTIQAAEPVLMATTTIPVQNTIVPETVPATTAPVVIDTTPATTPVPSITTNPVLQSSVPITNTPPKVKKNVSLIAVLALVIVALIVFLIYTISSNKRNVSELKYNCSPLIESNEGVELDINSTLVQTLYNRVYTSIREDYAEPQFNDSLKLYLAYRQITEFEKYDSNCNMFDNKKMEPYVCNDLNGVKPKAISLDTMRLKWKLLYGEETPMPTSDIKLSNLCIGGYQYIPEREEYVEGYCKQSTAISARADKKLVSAISYNNTIILTENVRYYGQEKAFVPDYLKNGEYKYLFRLDMNYNYVLISKTYEQKY